MFTTEQENIMSLTTTPVLNVVVPDISGDGQPDFIIAQLEPTSIWSGSVEASAYTGSKGRTSDAVYPDMPVLKGQVKGWVEPFTDKVYEPYTDTETGRAETFVTETPGRIVTLNITDKGGVVHRQQVFVSDDVMAAKDGQNIRVELAAWGGCYVKAGE